MFTVWNLLGPMFPVTVFALCVVVMSDILAPVDAESNLMPRATVAWWLRLLVLATSRLSRETVFAIIYLSLVNNVAAGRELSDFLVRSPGAPKRIVSSVNLLRWACVLVASFVVSVVLWLGEVCTSPLELGTWADVLSCAAVLVGVYVTSGDVAIHSERALVARVQHWVGYIKISQGDNLWVNSGTRSTIIHVGVAASVVTLFDLFLPALFPVAVGVVSVFAAEQLYGSESAVLGTRIYGEKLQHLVNRCNRDLRCAIVDLMPWVGFLYIVLLPLVPDWRVPFFFLVVSAVSGVALAFPREMRRLSVRQTTYLYHVAAALAAWNGTGLLHQHVTITTDGHVTLSEGLYASYAVGVYVCIYIVMHVVVSRIKLPPP
jgi:hypothetical protein